jgi:hypothetical protein
MIFCQVRSDGRETIQNLSVRSFSSPPGFIPSSDLFRGQSRFTATLFTFMAEIVIGIAVPVERLA